MAVLCTILSPKIQTRKRNEQIYELAHQILVQLYIVNLKSRGFILNYQHFKL